MNNGDNYAFYCLGLEYRNRQEFEKAFDSIEKYPKNDLRIEVFEWKEIIGFWFVKKRELWDAIEIRR